MARRSPPEQLEGASPYVVLKRAEIRSALPVEEQELLEHLEGRRRRSEASQGMVDELWTRAVQLHLEAGPKGVDDLFTYAEEIGGRMRSTEGRPG
jgi:hypothetical protein